MNQTLNQQLSSIFRYIEADIGTSDLANLVIESILSSVRNLKVKNVDEFYDQFKEVMLLIKSTKPRIGIIITYFCDLWDELETEREKIKTVEQTYAILDKKIANIKKGNKDDLKKIIKTSLTCIEENDTILIHSHSHTVLRVIENAWQKKKKFRVILAEQEEEKTKDIIRFLQNLEIPFFVVPEFMLSHIEHEVTKVFLGALTFSTENTFVTDAGTNSVVAEFHHAKVPIYLFISTKKFSLWRIESKNHTYKIIKKNCCEMGKHGKNSINYETIKFSHDRLPVDLVDQIITEEGSYTAKTILKAFKDKYRDRESWRKRHNLKEDY